MFELKNKYQQCLSKKNKHPCAIKRCKDSDKRCIVQSIETNFSLVLRKTINTLNIHQSKRLHKLDVVFLHRLNCLLLKTNTKPQTIMVHAPNMDKMGNQCGSTATFSEIALVNSTNHLFLVVFDLANMTN